MQTDRHSPIPLHAQLEAILYGLIESGELKPLDAIPSEFELMKKYNISRDTVRHAIASLVKEGFLFRKRGKGTFVSRPKERFGLVKLLGFNEEMRAKGLTPNTKVLELEIIEAPPQVAERLHVPQITKVWRISRLRLADDEPMCVQINYIPLDVIDQIEKNDLEGNGSLYDLLENHYQVDIAEADETVHAVLAWDEESRLLNIQHGAPLISRELVAYTVDGHPIEYMVTFYRADRYAFTFRSTRDKTARISLGADETTQTR